MGFDLISIVVPVYKKEKTIEEELENLYKVLSFTPYKFELIVVIDGKKADNSFLQAKKAKKKLPRLRVFGYNKNKGKGLAVRYGLQKAKGSVVGFIDSGGDINPQGVVMLIEHMQWYKADVIIGSKLHSASVVENYTPMRKLLTYSYYLFVKILFRMNIRDTQTGLKLLKRDACNKILNRMVLKRWAFDVEMLAIANYLGYKVYDAPVHIDFSKAKSNVISTKMLEYILFFLLDTLGVWYRLYILHYYSVGAKRQKRFDPDINMYVNTGRLKNRKNPFQK